MPEDELRAMRRTGLRDEKAALRRAVLDLVRGLPARRRTERSQAIVERVLAHPRWALSGAVFGFHPLPEEVNVIPALERALASGKSVWLPRIDGRLVSFHRVWALDRGLLRHAYGMQEPSPGSPRFDDQPSEGSVLILAPGVAFDREGNRLGRGKGYYDGLITRMRDRSGLRVFVLAVAFAEQLVELVPHGPEDAVVDGVVTDRETLGTRQP